MFTLVEIFPDSAMYLDSLRLGIFGFADAYIHYDTQSNHLSFRIQNPRTCNETGAILNGIHVSECTTLALLTPGYNGRWLNTGKN